MLLLVTALPVCLGSCGSSSDSDSGSADYSESSPARLYDEKTPLYRAEVVAEYPHDVTAFTQGLAFDDGVLYEGTGIRGRSSLREVDLETGTILRMRELDAEYFGEGITILGDRIIQLTWKENTGLVYEKATFQLLTTFDYPSEGWGMTNDGTQLIMSDGSATLRFMDPESYEITRSIQVRDDIRRVHGLNELEYYKGEVLANVWPTNRIARISPQTGRVTGWIQLNGFLGTTDSPVLGKVANGIAYDQENDRLFITGKYWPKLYQIEIVRIE
jgi:glutamine cyclotransferase